MLTFRTAAQTTRLDMQRGVLGMQWAEYFFVFEETPKAKFQSFVDLLSRTRDEIEILGIIESGLKLKQLAQSLSCIEKK
jgi:hypothetical protein